MDERVDERVYDVAIIVLDTVTEETEYEIDQRIHQHAVPFEGIVDDVHLWSWSKEMVPAFIVKFHSSATDLCVKLNNALIARSIRSYRVMLRENEE